MNFDTKIFVGYILFVFGLLLAIGQTLEQFNNVWWHLIGFGLIYFGLNFIIENKINKTNK